MKIVLFTNTSWNIFNYRINLIEVLESEDHDVLLLAPEDDYTQHLLEAGYHWKHFPISRKGMNPIIEINTIRELKIIYSEYEPDICFHYTPKCVLYGSLIAKKLHIPIIMNTITGLGYLFSGSRMRYPIIRETIQLWYHWALKNTKVIFQNRENMELFIQKKITDRKDCFLIPGSGVNIHKFFPLPETNDTPIVLFPARLIKEKGIFVFIEAAKILIKTKVHAKFVVVGKIDYGNPSAISEEVLNQWIESGIIEWWGWQSDMAEVFQNCHIICLPTYYNEGIPKTLIEAAACGKPIITSDTPGCREIVHDNVNGLLIQTQNSKILAEAIEKLLINPALRITMGLEGRKLVVANFQSQIIVSKVIDVAGLQSKNQQI